MIVLTEDRIQYWKDEKEWYDLQFLESILKDWKKNYRYWIKKEYKNR